MEYLLSRGVSPKEKKAGAGPAVSWDDFWEAFLMQKLVLDRQRTFQTAASRIGICARIIQPATVAEMADKRTLQRLQESLLRGDHGRYGKPRSRATVHSMMTDVLSCLSWAARNDYLDSRPEFKKLRPPTQTMKGRPLSSEEVEQLLAIVPRIVGDRAAPSW